MPRTDRLPSEEPRHPNRREFLWTLGAASALPLAGPASVWAQPPSTPAPTPETPKPVPDADLEKAADAADARSLLDIVRRKFGSRLDAEQLDSIRDDLEGNMRMARTLRALPLGNADEPDVVFRASILEGR